MDTLGLTAREVAHICGNVHIRTVRRWMAGKPKIPALAAERMRAELAKGRRLS